MSLGPDGSRSENKIFALRIILGHGCPAWPQYRSIAHTVDQHTLWPQRSWKDAAFSQFGDQRVRGNAAAPTGEGISSEVTPCAELASAPAASIGPSEGIVGATGADDGPPISKP